MNKQRRQALNALQDRITALDLSAMFSEVQDIASELETLRDEEQDARDNLPESLADSERAQDMDAALDAMGNALELLQAFADIEDNASEAFSNIEDAKGAA